MSDPLIAQPTQDLTAVPGRGGRPRVMAFVSDADTEAALRVGLVAASAEELIVYRGGTRHALTTMRKMPSPHVLVVDISDDEQPMSALSALSEVVEPDVRVLVIGARQDLDLYRQLTRTLGVAEYLYKPLSAEIVALHFAPHVAPGDLVPKHLLGGRILCIIGACGGVGATTVAANLSWYLANEVKRHTMLLDPKLHTGASALLLGAKSGNGLRRALEAPDRVDDVFVDRIADPVGARLSVIAAEEKLTEQPTIVPGAARALLEKLRRRYNYVVVDMPLSVADWHGELMDMARQRVLVMQPTLPSVRDTLRAMALPMGPQQIRRPLTVLNGLGAPGTMTRHEVEKALETKIDVTIPYLPRVVNPAAILARPAVASRGGFRTAIRELVREVAGGGQVTEPPGTLHWPFRRGVAR
jgi:pilus assembly protein CpaE